MSGMKRIANAIANEPGFSGQTAGIMNRGEASKHVDPGASIPSGPTNSRTREAGAKTPPPGGKKSGKSRPIAANKMPMGGIIPKAL